MMILNTEDNTRFYQTNKLAYNGGYYITDNNITCDKLSKLSMSRCANL